MIPFVIAAPVVRGRLSSKTAAKAKTSNLAPLRFATMIVSSFSNVYTFASSDYVVDL